jgi:thymidylate synthase
MELLVKNVNEAFNKLIKVFKSKRVATADSRNGPVKILQEPLTLTYLEPTEKVLFNPARDCNPFFHVMEALWMLAGRNDVAFVEHFNSNIKNYSDDGKTFHGAYGYRWRNYFGYDQLDRIAAELSKDPTSRRCVLQMWDGGRTKIIANNGWNCTDCGNWAEGSEEVEVVKGTGDLFVATHGGKDVPCNTNIYFLMRSFDGIWYLDMTVCNRSNDLIWGMLGANVVHMSFLLEYMAARIGCSVGRYHQITNNLHAYTDKWTPDVWTESDTEDHYARKPHYIMPLVKSPIQFEKELYQFMTSPTAEYKEPFLQKVAKPMYLAFIFHKLRDYDSAFDWCEAISSEDWRTVSYEWLMKRSKAWKEKSNG